MYIYIWGVDWRGGTFEFQPFCPNNFVWRSCVCIYRAKSHKNKVALVVRVRSIEH